jgi:ATP-dependent Clp protease ATP-binding subunit ClpC
MILGILRLAEGKAFEVLMQAGMNPVELKQAIDERLMQATICENAKMSRAGERIMRLMLIETRLYHADTCSSIHLLLGLLRERINFPAMYMEQQFGIDYERIEQIYPKPEAIAQDSAYLNSGFIGEPKEETEEKKNAKSTTPALEKYGRDLSSQAQKGELDPVIGRQLEIERIIQILSRRKKNNPILIGEPGVGKSAIVEGLALHIEKGEIAALKGRRIIALDIASMVAGTTYRGQFEERVKAVIKELHKHPEIILFVDEIHTIMGAGNAQGSLDAANILKPALARGEVQCIGATTISEYRKTIEKDGALERRFQKVLVQPASSDETYVILQRMSEIYGTFHQVHYTTEAINACVQLTERYITDRFFPDKALDAMDEAGAYKRQQNKQTDTAKPTRVTESDIAYIVSRMSGIPVQRVAKAEGAQLRKLGSVLKQQVIGQDKAIDVIVKAIQRSRVGLRNPNKPIGTFFLLGPTGVGKTHLAQTLAEELFGSKDAIIRFDMSEYIEKHTVSLLVGAPPGYIAHEEGGKLTEAVRRKPYSILLFDEIEKAHADIFNILLQVMDEGRLTDRQGRIVDFRNTIIIMTSNVGTRQLNDFGSVGFGSHEIDNKQTENLLTKALNRTFPPEFINRLDNVVVFHPLNKEALAQILTLELSPLKQRLSALGYTLQLTKQTKELILQHAKDPKYGARPLKRAIQTIVEDAITEILLTDKNKNKTIKI